MKTLNTIIVARRSIGTLLSRWLALAALALGLSVRPATAAGDTRTWSLEAKIVAVSELPDPDFPDDPTRFIENNEGTGIWTHLGKVTLVAQGHDEIVGSFVHVKNASIATAANGDQLFFSGEFFVNLADPLEQFIGTIQITGGTGHFNGATGSGNAIGFFSNGFIHLSAEGTMSPKGHNSKS